MAATATRTRRTARRTSTTSVSRAELQTLLNRISKRGYADTPQQERAFFKSQLRALLGLDSSN